MRIESAITGIDPQPHLMDFFQDVLLEAAGRVGVETSWLSKVVIASEDRYGDAIRSVDPGGTYTDTGEDVGVGKTIPASGPDGTVTCTVILRQEMLGGVGAGLETGLPTESWDAEQQNCFYIICHEFGHCRDYRNRVDLHSTIDPRSGPFTVRETAAFFGHIVLTEFAACRHAAVAMPDTLFNYTLNTTGERLVAVQRVANSYLDQAQNYTPRAVAHTVCQAAWVFMTELSKLYGHAEGTASRYEVVRQVEAACLDHSPLGAIISHLGEEYPLWKTSDLIDKLTDIWHQYVRLWGVQFRSESGGQDECVSLG